MGAVQGGGMNVQVPKGYKQTEVGVIPEDWQIQSIGFFDPFVTSGSRGWANYYSEYGSLFVRITNLQRSSIYLNLDSVKFVSLPSGSSEGIRTKLKQNDVLISITADIGISGFVDQRIQEDSYINQHISLVRFDDKLVNSKYVSYFLASEVSQKRFKSLTDAGAKAGLNLNAVKQIPLLLPPTTKEQQAIAEALSDTDALIESLEQLIAKKRQIKQGAMQELLTGQRRLRGFSGEWIQQRLGDIAHIKTGGRNNQDKVENGEYPFFVRSATVERINTFTYDCEAILVPGEGGIGSIFHYIFGKFDVHQRVYAITQFAGNISGKFIYYYMKTYFGRHAMENSVKATVDSLRLPTFQDFIVNIPFSMEEQIEIASILSEMEQELEMLEERLQKAQTIKQAMMQELLTGRIRLI